MIAHSNGGIGCWRQPELAPWEVPRRDPAEPRPTPELKARLRERQRLWRERQRARKGAKLAAGRGDAAGGMTSPHRGHHRCQQY
jgi:hypothetical protein